MRPAGRSGQCEAGPDWPSEDTGRINVIGGTGTGAAATGIPGTRADGRAQKALTDNGLETFSD